MPKNPQDYTFPNPPNDIPKDNGSSPLMGQVTGAWGLPWTKKPLGKPGKSGKPGPKTSRSGVHRLGRQKKNGSFY